MNLYELTEAYAQVQELLNESDDVSIIDTLDSLDDAIDAKVDNTVRVLKNLQAQVDAIKVERDRLYTRQKVLANNIDAIKERLVGAMDIAGKKTIDTGLFKVTAREGVGTVVIAEEEAIPQEFVKPPKIEFDKMAIKKALASGEIVHGAFIEKKKTLSIR